MSSSGLLVDAIATAQVLSGPQPPPIQNGTLIGAVGDKSTSQPLSDVLVSCNGAAGNIGNTRTDSNGSFSIDLIPDNYTVKLSKSGYTDYVSQATVTAGQTSTIGEIQLSPSQLPIPPTPCKPLAAIAASLMQLAYSKDFVEGMRELHGFAVGQIPTTDTYQNIMDRLDRIGNTLDDIAKTLKKIGSVQ